MKPNERNAPKTFIEALSRVESESGLCIGFMVMPGFDNVRDEEPNELVVRGQVGADIFDTKIKGLYKEEIVKARKEEALAAFDAFAAYFRTAIGNL